MKNTAKFGKYRDSFVTASAVLVAIFPMIAAINTQPILSPRSASADPPPGRGPNCPTGFTYNDNTEQCEASACPTGTSYDPTTNQCVDGPACPSGATLQGQSCVVTPTTTANQCPSGYTATGTGQGTCTIRPSCTSGTRLYGSVCQTNPIPRGPRLT